MTGPQHYTEAERLITEFEESKTLAAIHATLAQAAATALARPEAFTEPDIYQSWQEAAGGPS